jgi:hypothetical protein
LAEPHHEVAGPIPVILRLLDNFDTSSRRRRRYLATYMYSKADFVGFHFNVKQLHRSVSTKKIGHSSKHW